MRATFLLLLSIAILCAVQGARVQKAEKKGRKTPKDLEIDVLVNDIVKGNAKRSRKTTANDELRLEKRETKRGEKITRLQQYYDDIRVLGGQIIDLEIEQDTEIELMDRKTRMPSGKKLTLRKGHRRGGRFIAEIQADVGTVDKKSLKTQAALAKLKEKRAKQAEIKARREQRQQTRGERRHKGKGNRNKREERESDEAEVRRWKEHTESVIRIDEKTQKATVNYIVSYMVELKTGNIQWPHALLDQDMKILAEWNGLKSYEDIYATGNGGNLNTLEYVWGEASSGKHPSLQIQKDADTCFMKNAYVKTVDLVNTTSEDLDDAFSWSCDDQGNTHRDGSETNGAFGPINDAHGAATMVLQLFDVWYAGLWPLPVAKPLKVRANYGDNYENAFWDGEQVTFGNGADFFHPLSTMDIVAHEIAHGVTDFSAKLIYSGEAGGLNEAFSDMLGIFFRTMDFHTYPTQPEKWTIGGDAVKGPGVLRHMDAPELDGVSYTHTMNMSCNLFGIDPNLNDPHHTSGILNKVFTEFVKNTEWGLFDGAEVFMAANLLKWTETTTFAEAGESVLEIIEDLKVGQNPSFLPYDYSHLDTAPMVTALASVGVTCTQGLLEDWSCASEFPADRELFGPFGWCDPPAY